MSDDGRGGLTTMAPPNGDVADPTAAVPTVATPQHTATAGLLRVGPYASLPLAVLFVGVAALVGSAVWLMLSFAALVGATIWFSTVRSTIADHWGWVLLGILIAGTCFGGGFLVDDAHPLLADLLWF